jgi:hypothetical protein
MKPFYRPKWNMNEISKLKALLTEPAVIFLVYLILKVARKSAYKLISDTVDHIIGTKKENDRIRAMQYINQKRHDKAVTRLEEANKLVEEHFKKEAGE